MQTLRNQTPCLVLHRTEGKIATSRVAQWRFVHIHSPKSRAGARMTAVVLLCCNSIPLFQYNFHRALLPRSPVSGMQVFYERACFLCCLLLLFFPLVLVSLHGNINTCVLLLHITLSFNSYEIFTLGS